MEFDTGIKLREVRTAFVPSVEGSESFMRHVWEVAGGCSSSVADTGGEVWADYSDFFRTRHLVIDASPADGGYKVRFRAGARPGMAGDVVVMAAVLLMFWLMGKAVASGFSFIVTSGAIVAAVVAVAALAYCGKHFGAEEAGEILEKL